MCNKVIVRGLTRSKFRLLLQHLAKYRKSHYMLQDVCFSDINISQGSVATRLRRGGIFLQDIPRNVLLSVLVKEF